MNLQWTELIIFTLLFGVVSVMGFVAARWRRPDSMDHLNEWGLGGRNFGTWVSWFLIGGDLYTAYTFVAVPALVFSAGAAGFFALPYTVIAYPIVFLFLIRLWSVSKQHGYVTPADFVRGRFGSPTLALLIAVTGIVATMPYIALQLVGIEAVLKSMGLTGGGIAGHLPIVIAFGILAAYTYQSGLRAPALIAFVKDILIYVVILVAIIYIPTQLGGWDAIFDAADDSFTEAGAGGVILSPTNQLQYISVALGSALALFLYPHSITGVLSSRSRNTIKRNMSALPAYSFLLGLIALLGFMALAAGTKALPTPSGAPDTSTIVPELFDDQFSDWFAGVAFAAVGIGALVPAAIMSIAAANLFTRNIYKEYLRKDATPAQETTMAKIVSLVVKVGAVACIIVLPVQFAIDLQLIGGVIILQTLPSVALGLFTRWFHKGALIGGWFAGMGGGMLLLYLCPSADGKRLHFGGSAFPLRQLGIDTDVTIYAGFLAIAVNLLVVVALTPLLRALKVGDGPDSTKPLDYFVDADGQTSGPDEPAAASTSRA